MRISRKEIVALTLLVVVFVALRLPSINAPYHQDEYKWPVIVNPELTEPGGIPHPPVGEFIYRSAGQSIGFDNFRLVPLVFSTLNLVILFLLLRARFGFKTAAWGGIFFTVGFYSILASLMIDTDGAILPFFFLLAVSFYYLWREEKAQKKFLWLVLLGLSVALGLLVKMSFALVPVTLLLTYILENWEHFGRKLIIQTAVLTVLLLSAGVLLILLAPLIFPYFNLEKSLVYWQHFADFKDRNYFQSLIQFIKALLYLSPFLPLSLLLVKKTEWRRVLPWWIYLGVGLIFYLVIFDFSDGALDRYFQFMILPLSAIAAVVTARLFETASLKLLKPYLIGGLILTIGLFSLQFISHLVPPLYPKAVWIGRALSFKWNFLFPFSGGSGPLPFYVSFLFMQLSWLVVLGLIIWSWTKKVFQPMVWATVLIVSLGYGVVFIEEYHFGKINGFAPGLVKEAVAYVAQNDDIGYVTVYNDNGGYEIQSTGKYRKRLYTAPYFDQVEKAATLNKYKEHYLEINIPRIDPESIYRKYLDSCEAIWTKTSGQIYAKVYNCRSASDVEVE